MGTHLDFRKYHTAVDRCNPIRPKGKVTKVVGLVAEANGPATRLGSICEIYPKGNLPKITAEVLGFRDNKVLLMPLEEIRGISRLLVNV